MSVTLTFVPAPAGPDPLNIDQVVAIPGIYGRGSDNPFIAVEDDGSVYSLTPNEDRSGFVCAPITDTSVYAGQSFRRVHGTATVEHVFES